MCGCRLFGLGDSAGDAKHSDGSLSVAGEVAVPPEQAEWNERFQTALEQADGSEKHAALEDLTASFLQTSLRFGKQLISELFLPEKERTLQRFLVPTHAEAGTQVGAPSDLCAL